MNKPIATAGILAVLGLLPVVADAACTKSNAEVARVTLQPGGTATTASATIFLRHPNSRSEAVFSAFSENSNVITAALNAAHTRTKVTVTGDAATCPASGSIGSVTTFTTD